MPGAPTVLVDATILATATRSYGIGRYVRELVAALGRATTPLRLRYAARVGPFGAEVVDSAEEALVRTVGQPERGRAGVLYGLRLGAHRAAHAAGADVLHVPHTMGTPLFGGGARRIVTCHDLIPLHYPDHYLDWRDGWLPGRRWLDRRRTARADHIITVSQATADDVHAKLGVPRDRLSPILLGIDTARWSATPQPTDAATVARLGIPEPFVLFVGDADWRKNAAGMCAALADLQRRGAAVTLAWPGRLSPSRQREVTSLAAALGVDVRLLGYVPDDDLAALYRRTAASLFVSFAEGFGFPVLEAMAMGAPVVTSDRTSLPEVAGGAALVVPPDRPDMIADAIARLLRHPDQRAQLRQRGLARAAELTLERQAAATLEVYARVARGA